MRGDDGDKNGDDANDVIFGQYDRSLNQMVTDRLQFFVPAIKIYRTGS